MESEELLRSLYCNDTWNREIHRIIESELKDMPNTLRLPNINHKLELLIGIIGFLSYNSQKWNPIDKLVSEWSLVSLKGGSL